MARRSLNPQIADVLELEEGKEVKVVFQDTFTASIRGRATVVHNVTDAEGKTRSIWGSMGLNRAMANAKRGDILFITYRGKVDLEGGNTFKNYDVEVEE